MVDTVQFFRHHADVHYAVDKKVMFSSEEEFEDFDIEDVDEEENIDDCDDKI